jgi:hypothetical protein
MTILKTLQNSGRAAVLAIALVGVGLGVAEAKPLQAFQLDLGIQQQQQKQGGDAQFKKSGPNKWDCLTNKQIRKGLKSYGFYDIDFVANLNNNRVRVEAGYDDWYYSMRIDRCDGEVDKIKKLYPAFDEDDFPF